jgi:hypothetical protein
MNIKELFKDALPLIVKFAPTLGSAIGGPVGMAAGYVIPVLASAFESSPSDIKSLAQTIVDDPNSQQKLAELEKMHGDVIATMFNTMEHLASAKLNIELTWQPEQK